MEVPFNRSMTPRAYHTPVRQSINLMSYEDDDVISRSSSNFPTSNCSAMNFEPPPPEQRAAGATPTSTTTATATEAAIPSVRVRDIVKLFDAVAKSSTTSVASTLVTSMPVRRVNSIMLTSPKPYYGSGSGGGGGGGGGVGIGIAIAGGGGCGGGVGGIINSSGSGYGNVNNNYSGSQTSVKQFVSQYQESEEQSKLSDRCRRCNAFMRCDCLSSSGGGGGGGGGGGVKKRYSGSSEYSRNYRTDTECSSASITPSGNLNVGVHANSYLGFVGNRNKCLLRSPAKEPHGAKDDCAIAREPRLNSTELYDDVDCGPAESAYDSKTTIIKTPNGVRIVVDIMFNQMQNLSTADVACNRVETDIPRSRILTEFQQQSALTMGRAHAI